MAGFITARVNTAAKSVRNTFRVQSLKPSNPVSPFPYGSAVVGIEYEDEGGRKGRLIRFIQMEKVPDFGKSVPQSYRNGDWQYSSFTPQKRLITDDPVQRCMSCHKRASDTVIFGFDSMKAFSENR